MATGHLLTSQTNDLVRRMQEHGFRREEIRADVVKKSYRGTGRDRVTFVHRPTHYSFDFRYQGRGDDPRPGAEQRRHSVTLSPGEAVHDEDHHNLTWEDALAHFDRWLRFLRREIDAPDLLAQAEQERQELLEAHEWLDSEGRISPEEQTALREQLETLKNELADLQIYSQEELTSIRSRIDELEGDLGSLRRWKWATLALGMPFRIQALLEMDADQFRQLWTRVVRIISDLPRLLPPGG